MSVVLSNNEIPSILPLIPNRPLNLNDNRVVSAALPVLIELGVSLLLNYVILSSVGSNFTLLLCAGYTVISLAHVAYVVASEYFFDINHQQDPFQQDRQGGMFSLAHTVMHAGISSLIHECGHAFAAWMLLIKANPQITVSPFRGGSTSYVVSYGLTSLGNFFGKEGSLACIKAAGMASSTLFATLALIFAGSIQESFPTVSEGFTFAATSMILSEIVNGLTTLVIERNPLFFTVIAVATLAASVISYSVKESYPKVSEWLETAIKICALNELINHCWNFGVSTKRLSNDYINLWVNHEIHPLIPMGLVAGIPLATKLFLDWYYSPEMD